MRRIPVALLLLLALVGSVAAAPANGPGGVSPLDVEAAVADAEPWDRPVTVRAGVGVADATWHVGASAGQYTDIRDVPGELAGGDVDPHAHSTWKQKSYGVQSRLTIRAIVVEGNNGERIALVKSDNYLAQDHLLRRVGQLLDEGDSGVGYGNILHAASHNHSSPYYATPSWGVWLFQDVMDLRMFEYQARAMATAIEEAAANLVPARMGATVVQHDIYKGNIMRPQTADDGSPAGYPADHGDKDLTVLRFDDLSTGTPEPMAVWMNWGQHPESLDGYDLITADFLAPLERFVERDTGATLVFSQGDVGSAEGPYTGWNRGRLEDGTLVAWAHVGHAQTERGARLLADSVVEAFDEIGRGAGTVPFTSDFEVGAVDGWVPGPLSHPYPSISNCRSESTATGDPGAPVLGLPDCARPGNDDRFTLIWENLKAHGIPVPDHYDAPGFSGVEENLRLRLQVLRLGDVVIGSCACEALVDLIVNFKTRANDVEGDLYDGFDWLTDPDTTCTEDGGTWTCVHEGATSRTWTFSDSARARMLAQVHNPADGWDAIEYTPFANSEPTDPEQIKGNFTREELDAETGYRLVVGVGHAGDYNGYTVSYREYMGYDHYRKALTSHGPHTADYMVTRLVRMAGELNGGPAYEGEPHDMMADADEARQVAMSLALGQASSAAYEAWMASLPDDVGPAEALAQPADVTRFAAAEFQWRGGSNAIDNPSVVVERLVEGAWVPFADMSGEVQTRLDFPNGYTSLAAVHSGSQAWVWTANFEAFTAGPDRDLEGTPLGTYRFVVDGMIHAGGAPRPYSIASEPFAVTPWTGIEVTGLGIEGDAVVVDIAPVTYPRTYESSFPFIGDDGREDVCKTCSFRAWAPTGEVHKVRVTLVDADGRAKQRIAKERDGRWVVDNVKLDDVVLVRVQAGDVTDRDGNTNAAGLSIEL